MVQQIDEQGASDFSDFEQAGSDYFNQIEALDQATADINHILARAHDKATQELSDKLQADDNERNNSK